MAFQTTLRRRHKAPTPVSTTLKHQRNSKSRPTVGTSPFRERSAQLGLPRRRHAQPATERERERESVCVARGQSARAPLERDPFRARQQGKGASFATEEEKRARPLSRGAARSRPASERVGARARARNNARAENRRDLYKARDRRVTPPLGGGADADGLLDLPTIAEKAQSLSISLEVGSSAIPSVVGIRHTRVSTPIRQKPLV